MNQAGTGISTKRGQPDVDVFSTVHATDAAWQHAGIRRLQIPTNQSETHAWFGPHGKGFEHLHVAVPAADQDNITQGWNGIGCLHVLKACQRSCGCTRRLIVQIVVQIIKIFVKLPLFHAFFYGTAYL